MTGGIFSFLGAALKVLPLVFFIYGREKSCAQQEHGGQDKGED